MAPPSCSCASSPPSRRPTSATSTWRSAGCASRWRWRRLGQPRRKPGADPTHYTDDHLDRVGPSLTLDPARTGWAGARADAGILARHPPAPPLAAYALSAGHAVIAHGHRRRAMVAHRDGRRPVVADPGTDRAHDALAVDDH